MSSEQKKTESLKKPIRNIIRGEDRFRFEEELIFCDSKKWADLLNICKQH